MNATVTTTHAPKTRLSKGGDAHPTALTIEWDIDEAKLRELAAQTLVIRLQGNWRAAGTVPGTVTVRASEVKAKRGPATPITAARAVATLPIADLLEALKAAGALTPEVLKGLSRK